MELVEILKTVIYVVLGVGAIVLWGWRFIKLVWNKLRSGKSAKTALKEAVAELKLENIRLSIERLAIQLILDKEDLYKNETDVKKTGAFKFDSVLKEIELECIRQSYEYVESYWTQFINNKVSEFKAVK